MLNISFKYRDELSHGEWNYQSCTMSSVKECITVYGLGVDCDYEILEISDAENTNKVYNLGEVE